MTAANEATLAVKGSVVVPLFKETASKPTDFNDLFVLEGAAEVKRQIEAGLADIGNGVPASLPRNEGNATALRVNETTAAPNPREAEAEIQRLAALSPLAYDLERDEAAAKMGVRIGTLDMEVAKRRDRAAKGGPGRAITFDDPEPWPDPVNGSELLNALAETYSSHLILPPGAVEVLSVWVILTYCFAVFDFTPIIFVTAPEKGCGKSRVRDLSLDLVYRPMSSENASTSYIFRLIERDQPTVFLDEFDNADMETRRDLLSILNSGFHRNGAVGRVVGEDHEPRQFSTYGPKMLVGIGNHLPDSTRSRCIVIPIRRKLPSEVVASLRGFDGNAIRQRIRRWVDDNRGEMASASPLFPDWMDDRQRDIMEPLLVIADLAGGEWPRRIREALRILADGKAEPTAIGPLLLADIRNIFGVKDRLASAEILKALNNLEERPWPGSNRGRGFDAKNMAKILRTYDIESRSVKLSDGSVQRGFHRDQFEEAFGRYLTSATPTVEESNGSSCYAATKAVVIGQNPLLTPATNGSGRGCKNTTSLNVSGLGSTVAAGIPPVQPEMGSGSCEPQIPPPERDGEWESDFNPDVSKTAP